MTIMGPLPVTGVALAGFMGVGKSTVGPLVADRLGLPWWDLDRRVEERSGQSISDLFRTRGEAVFRDLELEALRSGLAEGPAVVSLGGGVTRTRGAVAALKEAGFRCVVLHASWATIATRIQGGDRPLAAEAQTRFEERRAHYLQLGTQIPTDGRAADAVAAAVVDLVMSWC